MKSKHLIWLAVALVLLLAVRFLVDRGPGTASSLEDAGLSLVVRGGPEPSAVTSLRVSGPGGGEPLVVDRVGSGWVVASAHGAPADADKVESFLESVAALRGELRGEGESLFEEFGVDAGSAARLELFAGDGEPSATVYFGKEGDSRRSHFVRVEGEERIHHVVDGVLGDLGLVGDGRVPKSDHWLRLQLFDLAPSEVTLVTADLPDQNWRFEKSLLPGAEEGAEPAWRVIEPQLGAKPKATAMQSLVDRVARVRAASVLDPATEACADEALDQRLSLTTAGTRVLRFGSTLLEDDLVAARLDDEPTCWGLKRWTAESLMPRASQLFELAKPLGDEAPAAEEVTRIDLVQGESWLRLEREGEAWRLTQPRRAEANSARVDRLLSALRFLAWEDFALEAAVLPAARESHATLTVQAGDRSFELELLGERPTSFDGDRYARFEGGPSAPSGFLSVVPGSAVDSLTPDLEELEAAGGEDG